MDGTGSREYDVPLFNGYTIAPSFFIITIRIVSFVRSNHLTYHGHDPYTSGIQPRASSNT
jgi:NADH:ubiquinone oxidoreductase subunit 3 (subunit A)